MQKQHHSEPLEIKLQVSLTATELKKPHISRLVGGVQMHSGLVPHPCVVDKNLEGLYQEWGVIAPHQAPKPKAPVPEGKSSILAAKNSGDWVCGRNCWSSKWSLLKTPQTDSHLLGLTPSEFQHRGSSLKGTSGIEGETEVSGIKASWGHCPLSKPSPKKPAG